ncbi:MULTISPECIES: type IV pili methyl-accepting chemotaxis transducer N-terminal domain-containing protein [unclassified Acidovorax]|uniref:type IV pili methyl-accepting chemotaxis transducer N-terminal domain-containing protein n=1 Tax=unclassified Acidovorax TaxID=2684926 RepID=UPI001C45CE76|nr:MULTISPECIES: type IV pili methyl-accepting chemotaxis transducer N-terminal domain-containing protein [unclassified Acidovorax]MBV7460585.1 type IV pili methyl-accepting chemotaxis transducer N-terminal domain-containing protein [Acidovorax sp. sif0632]MBV7465610.1 type IV pili methyl-accepting chemotaxis transducer N-terminal domain-containing protein [Acidovorax sp. sif0613]
MLTREFSADATPCQRRVALQRVAAGVLLPTWATWATGAQAQMGLSGAINYAGWFRALSQRMAKAYCQQYLQVLPAAAVDVMGLARKMVQTGSGELARGMQSGQWPAEVGRQLAEVQKQFSLLNQMTSAPATTTALVAAASEQADRTLLIAQAVTEAIEKMAQAPSARLVNLAGRQRMLSQRLAKNYFLSAAKVDSKVVQAQLASDAADFRQALQTLKAAPVSTSSIRNELELADSQWLFFESALRRPADDAGLNAVATTSERLLGVMDKLTGLYDAALREVLG